MKSNVRTAQRAQDQSPFGALACIIFLLAAGVFVKLAPAILH